MENELISVIIPVYNVPIDSFARCIASFEKQSYPNWEIIVVDDGSKKNASQEYYTLCATTRNCLYTRQENRGASSARNKGTELAKGNYIVYADADDYVLTHYLQSAYDKMKEYALDFIIGGVCHEPLREWPEEFPQTVEVFADDKSAIVEHFQESKNSAFVATKNWAMGSGPVARMVTARLAKQTRFREDIPLNEDTLWNMEILRKSKRVGVAQDTWYIIVPTPDSSTRRYRPHCVEESERQLAYVRQEIDKYFPLAKERYYSRVLQDFGRIIHLQLMHPASHLTMRSQYSVIKQILQRDPWKEAVHNVDLNLLNRNRKILVGFARQKWYFLIWLICKLRSAQMKGKVV